MEQVLITKLVSETFKDKIFETKLKFHETWLTTRKVEYLSFSNFILILAKLSY